MIKSIKDYNKIKKDFNRKFENTLRENLSLQQFCYEVFTQGTAYIVGGYLRDIALEKDSRDMDMLVHLPNSTILEILRNLNVKFDINRLNGIKMYHSTIEVDVWSIDHNWAFESKVVGRNEDNILESIGNGCFYNYDSLVIDILTTNLNVRNYNNLAETNTLDILRKNKLYRKLNPTIEANILRAFFLKEKYALFFSDNCLSYLISRIGYLDDQYKSSLERLNYYICRYPKYKELLDWEKLHQYINYCKDEGKQRLLNFDISTQ